MSRPWYSIFEWTTFFTKIGDAGFDSTSGVDDVDEVDDVDKADDVDEADDVGGASSSSSDEDFWF